MARESGGQVDVVSGRGATGLMQLLPSTAKSMGVTNIWDPAQNIEGGAKYFAMQLKRFGRVELALAAYNAGPNAVALYGGIPPFGETQRYVKGILSDYNRRLAS